MLAGVRVIKDLRGITAPSHGGSELPAIACSLGNCQPATPESFHDRSFIPSFRGSPRSIFAAEFRRFLEASGCRTPSGLAELLEIRQSLVTDAIRGKILPAMWLVKLYAKKRVNSAWVSKGEDERFLPDGARAASVERKSPSPDEE